MATHVSQTPIASVLIGPAVPLNYNGDTPATVLVNVAGGSTLTFSVEATIDPLGTTDQIAAAVWFPLTTFTAKTATTVGIVADSNNLYWMPVVAVRLNVTAWTVGSATLKVLQGDSAT